MVIAIRLLLPIARHLRYLASSRAGELRFETAASAYDSDMSSSVAACSWLV
jgi:hypothetical protein